jgi:hypothetical protein
MAYSTAFPWIEFLMSDAVERAKEAGVSINRNATIWRISYGY